MPAPSASSSLSLRVHRNIAEIPEHEREGLEFVYVDDGSRDGLTSSEREELARLRREVRVLREERDILKRATAFFARETR